jgi:hypothetical protein
MGTSRQSNPSEEQKSLRMKGSDLQSAKDGFPGKLDLRVP